MVKRKYSKPGRPTKYDEETLAKAYDYLNDCEKRRQNNEIAMPNAGGLSVWLMVHKDTLYEWEKVHPDFAEFMGIMNGIREELLHEGGLSGRYSSSIAAIMLGKHGYHRTVDTNIYNPDGSLNSPVKQLSIEELRKLAAESK